MEDRVGTASGNEEVGVMLSQACNRNVGRLWGHRSAGVEILRDGDVPKISESWVFRSFVEFMYAILHFQQSVNKKHVVT